LSAEDVPTEAEALRDELAAMLPVLPLASVLVEIDARTAFTGHLVHAGGKVNRPPELKRNLLYVIIAEATNMGLAEMAAATGISYDALAWTAEWYFRAETLAAASTAIVDYHHQLPFARVFGTGTLASSDGQRFPVQGKSVTARHLSRYFARGAGISAYTAVSDQHATLDTKVIPASAPEGHFVLDAILGNTDPPILEHATDTHGAPGQLRAVRPGRQAALAPDPGPGQDHLVPARAPSRLRGPLPARRPAADPPTANRPDHRLLG
jgi:Tn3 transposase DDE domain-containing protein